MFEKDYDYYKARKESKISMKAIKVWSGKEEAIHDASFEKGAEFGYRKGLEEKANEWHYVINNDFPKEEGVYLVCRKYHDKKYLQLLEFDGSYWVTGIKDDPENFIIAWKEESLPE